MYIHGFHTFLSVILWNSQFPEHSLTSIINIGLRRNCIVLHLALANYTFSRIASLLRRRLHRCIPPTTATRRVLLHSL